jgi:hypothetical protein
MGRGMGGVYGGGYFNDLERGKDLEAQPMTGATQAVLSSSQDRLFK